MSVVDIVPLDVPTARQLEARLQAEALAYRRYFTAFDRPGCLTEQVAAARSDGFWALLVDGVPAGFYCMRGLDAGYRRPSFGIYVLSENAGRGLGRMALTAALDWSRARGIDTVMLKCDPANAAAWHLYHQAGFRPIGRCTDSGQSVLEWQVS